MGIIIGAESHGCRWKNTRPHWVRTLAIHTEEALWALSAYLLLLHGYLCLGKFKQLVMGHFGSCSGQKEESARANDRGSWESRDERTSTSKQFAGIPYSAHVKAGLQYALSFICMFVQPNTLFCSMITRWQNHETCRTFTDAVHRPQFPFISTHPLPFSLPNKLGIMATPLGFSEHETLQWPLYNKPCTHNKEGSVTFNVAW